MFCTGMKLFRHFLKLHRETWCHQMSVTSRLNAQVQVDGINLNYATAGQGEHAVLCLPGAMGSIESDFNPQLTGLDKDKLKVVVWDPPGYGHSRPPDRKFCLDFLENDAKLAAKLMQYIGYSKFSLMGWSDGGITSLHLASLFPHLVRKMVVWGANAYITAEDIKMYDGVRDIDKWSDRMRAPLIALYGEEYFRQTWTGWVDIFNAIYDQREGDLCRKQLANIRCPTLIIHGMKDPMVAEEHPYYLHKHIANSSLYIMEEGKHNLHLRFADEFNNKVTEFLLQP